MKTPQEDRAELMAWLIVLLRDNSAPIDARLKAAEILASLLPVNACQGCSHG